MVCARCVGGCLLADEGGRAGRKRRRSRRVRWCCLSLAARGWVRMRAGERGVWRAGEHGDGSSIGGGRAGGGRGQCQRGWKGGGRRAARRAAQHDLTAWEQVRRPVPRAWVHGGVRCAHGLGEAARSGWAGLDAAEPTLRR